MPLVRVAQQAGEEGGRFRREVQEGGSGGRLRREKSNYHGSGVLSGLGKMQGPPTIARRVPLSRRAARPVLRFGALVVDLCGGVGFLNEVQTCAHVGSSVNVVQARHPVGLGPGSSVDSCIRETQGSTDLLANDAREVRRGEFRAKGLGLSQNLFDGSGLI